MEKKTIKVEGMSCQHCVKAVTETLSSLQGISGVSVDLEGGLVSFNYDPSAASLAAVETAITDAGYDVTG